MGRKSSRIRSQNERTKRRMESEEGDREEVECEVSHD